MATKTATKTATETATEAKAAEHLATTNALREAGSRFLWSVYPFATSGSLIIDWTCSSDRPEELPSQPIVSLVRDASPGPVPFDRAYWALVEAVLKVHPKAGHATIVFETDGCGDYGAGQLPVPLYRV